MKEMPDLNKFNEVDAILYQETATRMQGLENFSDIAGKEYYELADSIFSIINQLKYKNQELKDENKQILINKLIDSIKDLDIRDLSNDKEIIRHVKKVAVVLNISLAETEPDLSKTEKLFRLAKKCLTILTTTLAIASTDLDHSDNGEQSLTQIPAKHGYHNDNSSQQTVKNIKSNDLEVRLTEFFGKQDSNMSNTTQADALKGLMYSTDFTSQEKLKIIKDNLESITINSITVFQNDLNKFANSNIYQVLLETKLEKFPASCLEDLKNPAISLDLQKEISNKLFIKMQQGVNFSVNDLTALGDFIVEKGQQELIIEKIRHLIVDHLCNEKYLEIINSSSALIKINYFNKDELKELVLEAFENIMPDYSLLGMINDEDSCEIVDILKSSQVIEALEKKLRHDAEKLLSELSAISNPKEKNCEIFRDKFRDEINEFSKRANTMISINEQGEKFFGSNIFSKPELDLEALQDILINGQIIADNATDKERSINGSMLDIKNDAYKKIFTSPVFLHILKEKTNSNSSYIHGLSMALAVSRELERSELSVNNENIATISKLVIENNLLAKNIVLLDGQTDLIIFGHDDLLKNEWLEDKKNYDELIKITKQFPERKTTSAIGIGKGKDNKQLVLKSISASSSPTTIMFIGHGSKESIYLSDINDKDPKNINEKITFSELGSALIASANIQKINIFIGACYSYDFIVNLYEFLESQGEFSKPNISISEANRDSFGFGHGLIKNTLSNYRQSGAKSLTAGNIMDAESKVWALEDPAFFIPMPKEMVRPKKKETFLEISSTIVTSNAVV